MDIRALQQHISSCSDDSAMPPVDKWNPDFCGHMNLVIKRNGQWWHEGTPFTRAPLIKLFSSVIKKEGDDYFLVTPVEKIGITVEDVPFIIIDDDMIDGKIRISTSCGDRVYISEEHPVELREFEGNKVPYCHIRRNLWARVHQNVLYRWADSAFIQKQDSHHALLMQSGHYAFQIGCY